MVVVWSQPNCQPCRATKRWLTERGVEFEERNIQEDLVKLEEFRQAGFIQSPVVESDTLPTFSGFRPDLINVLAEN